MTNKTVHSPCPYTNEDCPVCKNKEYTDEKLLEVYPPLNRDTYQNNNPLINKIKESEERATELFAEREHIRWAKWQNYLHTFLVWNENAQSYTLPQEKKEHWESQIRTPYSQLSEKEKDSDREQVKPYLNYIRSSLISLLEENIVRLKAEIESEEPEKEEFEDNLYDYEFCRLIGRNQIRNQEITFYQQTIDELRK